MNEIPLPSYELGGPSSLKNVPQYVRDKAADILKQKVVDEELRIGLEELNKISEYICPVCREKDSDCTCAFGDRDRY